MTRNTIKLDSFMTAYLECALWSSTDGAEDRPLDKDFSIYDFNAHVLRGMIRECDAFRAANAEDLATIGDAQAGHDFWLTRNGHGCGFWDRGNGALGDRLADAARTYGEVNLYTFRGRVYANGFEAPRRIRKDRGYWCVLVPYTSVGATQWHPTVKSGPFSVLVRGAFPLKRDTLAWAREHLGATAYTVQHRKD